MGMLDWFKRLAGMGPAVDTALPIISDEKGAEVGGLNFMTAIDAHMKWKSRLENYIQGTSEEELKVEVVSCDDKCPLGKWIYSAGGDQFGGFETFGEMKVRHAQFHQCAGRVLDAAQKGRKEEAMGMLQRGDYVRASERVKMLLAKLYVQISEGK
ncbi:MAG: CZB domain-containing protein [Rhodocyclaceae bacterium]|nr:CZB domain-containing protein [Rhodocyclaceae bacterium]